MFTSSHGFGCSACEKGRYRQRDKETKRQKDIETKRQLRQRDKKTKTEAAAHARICRHACVCAVRDDKDRISVSQQKHQQRHNPTLSHNTEHALLSLGSFVSFLSFYELNVSSYWTRVYHATVSITKADTSFHDHCLAVCVYSSGRRRWGQQARTWHAQQSVPTTSRAFSLS